MIVIRIWYSGFLNAHTLSAAGFYRFQVIPRKFFEFLQNEIWEFLKETANLLWYYFKILLAVYLKGDPMPPHHQNVRGSGRQIQPA